MRSKNHLRCGGRSMILTLLLAPGHGFQSPPLLEKRPSSLVTRSDIDGAHSRPLYWDDDGNHSMAHKNDKLARRMTDYDGDSVEKYAEDVARVLKLLRPEQKDPAIPKTFKDTRLPSFVYTWTREDWRIHTRRRRYLDYIISFPTSRLLKRVGPALAIAMTWSATACWLLQREASYFKAVPLTPLSLISTFVAGLLTLRSNQGLNRLNEGRLACGKVVLYTRDLGQMIAAIVSPKDKVLALRAARHLSIFGWLLKNFLRGDDLERGGSDETAVVYTMLSPADAAFVMGQRKRPVAIVAVLRQVFSFMHMEGQLTTSEAGRLDFCLQQLNYSIMVTERIQASPIPPLYSAHAGRLLIFYLASLPLALYGILESTRATMIAVTVCAYTMLGLDEISHILEEPFRLMPLWNLSKNSMMDVADAIVCPPPPLFVPAAVPNANTHSGLEAHMSLSPPESPPYW